MSDLAPQKDFKPTFIPWYETDFRADRAVGRMTPVQRSFYRNLLLDCYFGENRPYISAEDKDLWLIADANSLDEWLAAKELIMTKFSPVELNDGKHVLSNKRCLEEWGRLEHLLKQKKNAGLASAEARRKKVKNSRRADKSTKEKKRIEQTTSTTDKSVAHALNTRSTDVQPVGVVEDAVSFSSAAKTEHLKSETDVIAAFQRVAADYVGVLEITKKHRQDAVQFYQANSGLALLAWEIHLLQDGEMIQVSDSTGKTHKELRHYPLQDFISSGKAQILADRLKPWVARGFTNIHFLDFAASGNIDFDDVADFTHTEINVVNDATINFSRDYQKFWESGDGQVGFKDFVATIFPAVAEVAG